jgi:triacylglycerol esterase/lipase EstA (alpha/beta hydrolase family)
MLAKLLRRLLATQLLLGAVLGWFLCSQTTLGNWLIPLTALLVPLAINLILIVSYAVKSRTPGQSALWWRSIWGEYVACCRVYMMQQPWGNQPKLTLPPAGVSLKTPVVLVHGYLCNHRVWDAMAEQLRQAGHPVLAVDLEPLFVSIDRYAPIIEETVSELCRQTGADQVALVGHSMGGLAIRAWMRSCGTERIAHIITLGTPHQGTRIDPHPKTPNGQQMAWHSDWLKALELSETPETRRLMHLALTPQDSIVYPQCEQRLEGAPVMIFEGLGHLELSQNREVGDWVLSQLH